MDPPPRQGVTMRSEPKVDFNRSAKLIRGKCIAVNKIPACTKIKSTYNVFHVINDTSEMILASIKVRNTNCEIWFGQIII